MTEHGAKTVLDQARDIKEFLVLGLLFAEKYLQVE